MPCFFSSSFRKEHLNVPTLYLASINAHKLNMFSTFLCPIAALRYSNKFKNISQFSTTPNSCKVQNVISKWMNFITNTSKTLAGSCLPFPRAETSQPTPFTVLVLLIAVLLFPAHYVHICQMVSNYIIKHSIVGTTHKPRSFQLAYCNHRAKKNTCS